MSCANYLGLAAALLLLLPAGAFAKEASLAESVGPWRLWKSA